MKSSTPKKVNRRRIIVLCALVILFATLIVLKSSTSVCEFFATTFSRAWIFLFGNLFGWIPVSLYELFLIAVLVGIAVFFALLIKNVAKRRRQKLLSLVLVAAITLFAFFDVYVATASFAYNREELPKTVYREYDPADFSYEQACALAETFVQRANQAYNATVHDETGNVVYPFTFGKLSEMLAEEYKGLDDDYFSSYTPRGKRIVNKWIMSQLHVSGVFFAPFGEANVNGNENSLYLPYVLAHEMAHGKGVMREYDADLVAFFVTITSDNPYLNYGSFVKAAFAALNLLKLYPNSLQTYNQLYDKLERGILTERRNYEEFYRQFTLLDGLGEFLNDVYLKLQKQDGTNSYVKPTQTEFTGEKDDFGIDVVRILRFSGTQNMLIHLVNLGLV